jgi:ankyrin repeat protein
VVELLLAFGADVGAVDAAGATPLHVAATRGCVAAANRLLVVSKVPAAPPSSPSPTSCES